MKIDRSFGVKHHAEGPAVEGKDVAYFLCPLFAESAGCCKVAAGKREVFVIVDKNDLSYPEVTFDAEPEGTCEVPHSPCLSKVLIPLGHTETGIFTEASLAVGLSVRKVRNECAICQMRSGSALIESAGWIDCPELSAGPEVKAIELGGKTVIRNRIRPEFAGIAVLAGCGAQLLPGQRAWPCGGRLNVS